MKDCINVSNKVKKVLTMIGTIFALQIIILIMGIVFGTNQVSATAEISRSIAITTPATKTTYQVGEDFDPAGMVVTEYFSDKYGHLLTNVLSSEEYTIIDDTDLQSNQECVIIALNSAPMKFTTHQIVVGQTAPENYTLSIAVTTPPTKTIYKAGQEFDRNGDGNNCNKKR